MIILDYSEQLKYSYETALRMLNPMFIEQTKQYDAVKDLKTYLQGFLVANFVRNLTTLRFFNSQPPGERTKEYDDYIIKLLTLDRLNNLNSI